MKPGNLSFYFVSLITAMCSFFIAGCVDDFEYNDPGAIPEGSTVVSMSVNFEPMSASVLSTKTANTNAPGGKAVSDIRDLSVLVYGSGGSLLEIHDFKAGDGKITISDAPRKDSDAQNGIKAEESTKQAKFNLPLPYGQYYIYCVANLGKADGSVSTRDILDSEGVRQQIQTVEGLHKLRTSEWDDTNMLNNAEMMGYFTLPGEARVEGWHNAPPVVINRDGMSLHSWVRRAVSKVTIDFDGTSLRPDVRIYLKSARIYDIPKDCMLGVDSKAGKGADDSQIIKGASSWFIEYGEGDQPKENVHHWDSQAYWPVVEKGTKYSYSDALGNGHSETARALYFYENMQGVHPDKDKRQFPVIDGELAGSVQDRDQLKDGVEYGTYIEVEGYYESKAVNNRGRGTIKYRFMLGKNVIDDYNAERNHHYKLTLKFRGNANDVDWHIEYKEDKDIYLPTPYYISYLYNHTMNLPLKINSGGRKISKITATIEENNWFPDGISDAENELYKIYYSKEGVTDNNWTNRANGFLSLIPTTKTAITTSTNTDYYYGNYPVPRNTRTFTDFSKGDHSVTFDSDTKDTYKVYKDVNSEADVVVIPMYTRALRLIATTGYTGNNSFVGHSRIARVHFKVEFTEGEPMETDVTVRQVPRIVNPKGIWRSGNSSSTFSVTLKNLSSEYSTDFEDVISDGPWRAYVVRSSESNFISLSETKGDTHTPISFDVRFNGVKPSGSRWAIIRVEYNNYTCVHLIFVRQGYTPEQIYSGDVKWHCFNMLCEGQEVSHPADEGSMFKFGNWTQAIGVGNTKIVKSSWALMEPSDFVSRGNDLFTLAGGGEAKWDDITFNAGGFNTTAGYTVAAVADYDNLINNTEQGFGVLYGDGATETASTTIKAYGYNSSKGNTEGYGMRGLFLYNLGNNKQSPDPEVSAYAGRNLFFPIGWVGYGNRKQGTDPDDATKGVNGEKAGSKALLRYSGGRSDFFPTQETTAWGTINRVRDKPMFWNLFRTPGALYWTKNNVNKGTAANPSMYNVVDINYFSFDVGTIPTSNVFVAPTKDKKGYSNAFFVRCIGDYPKKTAAPKRKAVHKRRMVK